MSDKYLFEKEGNDVEIERLERLLSVYRIEPVVPSLKRANESPAKGRNLFRFRLFYIPALASLVVAAVGLAFLLENFNLGNLSQGGDEIATINPTKTAPVEQNFESTVTDLPVINPAENPEPKIRVVGSPDRRPRAARVKEVQYRRRTEPSRLAIAKLTPEERYAYRQVLVALWITGSKLKVVQDTINRVNDENQNSATEKR